MPTNKQANCHTHWIFFFSEYKTEKSKNKHGLHSIHTSFFILTSIPILHNSVLFSPCLMFRPLYWNFVGLNRQYRRRYAFHVVVTPHTQQQTQRRAHTTVDELLRRYDIRLSELWFQLTENTCHWVNVGTSFLLYVKKKYNHNRRRWELELISLTPSQYTHTTNRHFARPIAMYSC